MRPKPGVGLYLKILSQSMEQYVNNQLQSRNLTFSQSKLLMVLGDHSDHAASMKELEEAFHSAQSTVCGIVSRMEKKGLVEAIPCEQDKRIKRIRLTGLGEEARATCISDIEESDRWITAVLDEDQRATLFSLLKMMCEEQWSKEDFPHNHPDKESAPNA